MNAGLCTLQGTLVPLLGVDVRGEVLGGHARTVVRQRYKNAESRPIEAVYVFPLPGDATLTGFVLECGGKRFEGEVKEREKAFLAYDDAITAGHGAALLDQERPNVFTANVGNLLPGEETIVEVEYVQRVQADEGTLRWVVPTLVAPRYIPGTPGGDRTGHGTASPTGTVPDADRISPPVGPVAYRVSLDILFQLGERVAVESPSHAIVTSKEPAGTRVRFAAGAEALDRDVVLLARSVDASPIHTVVTHRVGEGEGYAAITVVPDLFSAERRSASNDATFVIDVSGSMDGTSIVQAKAALRLCLRQLREGDRFNVIAFSSTYACFAPEPVRFSQSTLENADAWVQRLDANGGTEMLEPLRVAATSGSNIVVLLTDGQVGNELAIVENVLEAARKRSSGVRFYTFGIGTNVSDVLLKELARQSGGATELIHPGERIDDKVVAQFARATASRVHGLSMKLQGVELGELAPAELPALVDGEPWVLFGRYAQAGEGTLELRGTLDEAPFFLAIPLRLPARSEQPTVGKLWARERVRDLERAVLQGRRAEAMRERIVSLAVEHGIASSYTSFVVVEKRSGDRRTSGLPETRVVPVHAPAGWAMFHRPDQVDMLDASVTRSGVLGQPLRPAPRSPAPATGAPPPPRAAAMMSPPPPPPMPGRASPSRQGEAKADMTMLRAIRLKEEPAPPQDAGAVEATGLLQQQLATGLWGAGGTEAMIRATASALLALNADGITSAHAVYGAQVKKAVEALLPLLPPVASSSPRLFELGLLAAWLVASGPRTRRLVTELAARNGVVFGDEAANVARAKELALAP